MMEVHIFPENQRGATEGFRPWDQRPNSTMTNATVAQTVKGTDGQNILVKYKDGEKKVMVPPGTPIVTFVAGDKSELKAGAKVIIFGAVKKDDGTLEANRVNCRPRRHHAAASNVSGFLGQGTNPLQHWLDLLLVVGRLDHLRGDHQKTVRRHHRLGVVALLEPSASHR